MKILQINVWTGRINGALLNFIKSNNFDVICMQEAVWGDKREDLEGLFATADQIKEASGLGYDSRASNWGMKIFADDSIMEQGNVILSRDKILDEKNEIVFGEYNIVKGIRDLYEHVYTIQIAKLESGITIVNHHGYWRPTPLGNDTTVKVMKKVASVVHEIDGPVVMCGDLNIIYEAPAMRELDFLRDLTYEYHIDNTLSGLKFSGKVACDHILVNGKVKVQDFRVLDDTVSDHKPLVVEINI